MSINAIKSFKGKYKFLSNFVGPVIFIDGHCWATPEHAYQATKTIIDSELSLIWEAKSPSDAKKIGKKLTLRPNWDEIKITYMYRILSQKFSQEPYKTLLKNTGDTYLEEGNYWHDTFWGCCTCKKHKGEGRNELGKLLMQIRIINGQEQSIG